MPILPQQKTDNQYDRILKVCRDLFIQKFKDYGASWRVMRPASVTDQIFIKINRIRSIQEKGEQRVGEGIRPEFIAIVNYGIMGMVQIEHGYTSEPKESYDQLLDWYDHYADVAKKLMRSKNHDYDEAWRSMRLSSLVDLIMQKIYRTKQIEDNKGQTIISEGVGANYLDMINYAVFALIRMDETEADES